MGNQNGEFHGAWTKLLLATAGIATVTLPWSINSGATEPTWDGAPSFLPVD
jgi:hypothetical protein